MTDSVRLSSSLRSRPVEESLAIAESIAFSRGISRVVDTTWLDKIGIPVYASIRPDGLKESLNVHAGKGFTHNEAKIGAYMEAIEFSFAVPGRNIAKWHLATAPDVLKSFQHQIRFGDFCPRRGRTIQADSSIAVCEAKEILSNLGTVLVPAQLVYHPYCDIPGERLYGTTTNGLASGNTVHEAVVHGLAEVMERHVKSLDSLENASYLVDLANAPFKVKALAERVTAAGLQVTLRYVKNEFGLACFTAYVLEPDEHIAISVACGNGFHPIAEIAAVRAIAEAVQGRLSHIHGGRDDVIKRHEFAAEVGRVTELELIRLAREWATSESRKIDFEDVPDRKITSLDEAQASMFEGLLSTGMNHVAYVQLTPDDYPVQVVKVVVPGAEMYEHELNRVGERLMRHVLARESANA
jgi:ribosomal protein S12 methylthiotransferase accessory factor